jgi:hypothetical protein
MSTSDELYVLITASESAAEHKERKATRKRLRSTDGHRRKTPSDGTTTSLSPSRRFQGHLNWAEVVNTSDGRTRFEEEKPPFALLTCFVALPPALLLFTWDYAPRRALLTRRSSCLSLSPSFSFFLLDSSTPLSSVSSLSPVRLFQLVRWSCCLLDDCMRPRGTGKLPSTRSCVSSSLPDEDSSGGFERLVSQLHSGMRRADREGCERMG